MAGFLPLSFTTKMESLLDGEFERFMASYSDPRVYGLRVNRLKLDGQAWRQQSPIGQAVRSIPWAEDGFYYEEGVRPGKHPHYHAGLYYIQEPSAMAPVELLDVEPGHRVLDLCAAPGGKSTHIAGKLQGTGVLVSNDNARERTKVLAKNIELAGVRNSIVLNEEPSSLAPVFAEWFDRILVDAPCSGEGMFRKDESMIAEWEKHSIERCSAMQRPILRDAAAMLAPGGKLVYSTCTFSPEENEAQIAAFLAEQPEFEVVQVEHKHGWRAGRPDWAGAAGAELSSERLASLAGTVRLWPHLVEGEGHYAAILQRKGESRAVRENAVLTPSLAVAAQPIEQTEQSATNRQKGDSGKQLRVAEKRSGQGKRGGKEEAKLYNRSRGFDKRNQANKPSDSVTIDPAEAWEAFAKAQLSEEFVTKAAIVTFGSRVYLQPDSLPSLDGLRVVRAGWYVGEAGRFKFEPSQALAMGLIRSEAARSLNLQSSDPNTIRYLKGETLFVEPSDIVVNSQIGEDRNDHLKGYVLVCTDGYPIGWGKYAEGGMLKNELPAGWRWM